MGYSALSWQLYVDEQDEVDEPFNFFSQLRARPLSPVLEIVRACAIGIRDGER